MGEMKRKNSTAFYLSLSFLAITLILGTAQPVNAQFTNFSNCFVHAQWSGPLSPGLPISPSIPLEFDPACLFPVFNVPPTLTCNPQDPVNGGFPCTVAIPNFIDLLDNKLIFIHITFDPLDPFVFPIIPQTLCFDDTHPGGVAEGTVIDSGPDVLPGTFFYPCLR